VHYKVKGWKELGRDERHVSIFWFFGSRHIWHVWRDSHWTHTKGSRPWVRLFFSGKMPVPPVDMVPRQHAKGVRVKLFRRINPMSRFVDAEALLVLEAAMDSGIDLALVLNDQCWALLMLLEHGAAAGVLRQALVLAESGKCEGTVCGFVVGTCTRLVQEAMAYRAQTYANVYAMHCVAAVPARHGLYYAAHVGTPADDGTRVGTPVEHFGTHVGTPADDGTRVVPRVAVSVAASSPLKNKNVVGDDAASVKTVKAAVTTVKAAVTTVKAAVTSGACTRSRRRSISR